MQIGTKIRTLYEHSETATIVKPRKGQTPPTPDWFIVKFDAGGKGCIHKSMMVIRND